MRTRRPGPLTALAAVALVLATAAPATAHTTLDKRQVPYDVDVELTFRAPIERQGTTNARIEALLPAVFDVLGCRARTGWTCAVDTTSAAPDTVVVWDAITVGSPQDLTFTFSVHTPGASSRGDYPIPVVQTYSDGEEAAWINEDEPGPAPRLRVGPEQVDASEPTHDGSSEPPDGAATQEPSSPPTASASPQGAPDPDSSESPAAEPSSDADGGGADQAPEEAPAVGGDPAAAPDGQAGPTTEPDAAAPDLAVTEVDGGSSRALPVGLAVLVVAVLGGSLAWARGRR